ncbi:prohead core scaffold protein [Aeromonas phage ZPAH1]|nr:prohead core protein [Aeromonas phage Aswh_1]QQG34032.1 prohead core scaffold protein [Aeromonas phage ZPAH1]
MEEFIEAARAGNLLNARSAFETEMFSRIAAKTQEMRVQLGAELAPFEDDTE